MSLINTKLSWLALWLMVTGSGLAVVWATNESRALINQLLELRAEANQMLVAHGQYLLQERSLSSAASLEIVAVEKLGLRFPNSSDIQILDAQSSTNWSDQ